MTLPLNGLTVLDLSRVLAGPYCAMMLCDLGARVIKIEHPNTGDDARAIGPFNPAGHSAYFTSINRGKESIALDLKDTRTHATMHALLSGADIVVENYRPGVMDKLGFGWDALHARYPRLIYCAVSGFGQTGPDVHKAAYDMVVQGLGGIMSITGHPDGPPVRVGTSIGDITAGLFACSGVLAALLHRHKTGAGLLVDVAMLDGQIAILESAIARYMLTGETPAPLGARHPGITPFGAFQCADAPIIIAAGNDALWQQCAIRLGHPEWCHDPRFLTNADRTQNASALTTCLESVLQAHPCAHWLGVLEAVGVPCAPIHTIAQAVAMPQVQARTMIVDTQFEDGTPLRIAGNPMKLSACPDASHRPPAPALNAHGPLIKAALATPAGGLERDYLQLAHRMADAAAVLTRRFYRTPISTHTKTDSSPVTEADRAIEEALRNLLEREMPDHGIIGEEFAAARSTARWQWVIDPIDGTRSFIAGKPTFGTLIALLYDDVPVLGLIDQAIVGDRWLGARGYQTQHNGTPVQTRACADLAWASIATTGPNYFHAEAYQAYEQVRSQTATSLWGGDCYNYGLLASGHIDVVIESGLKLHDFAALVPIITGAGGVISDWHGAPLTRTTSGDVLAVGDPQLHAIIQPLLVS